MIQAYISSQNYDTTESKLRREFEGYGPIKKVYLLNFQILFRLLY